ncbi:MAG: 2-oxo acid dehydrogenase subunit E2 [Kurthia sp.]|nr:2-oxo acid dehydrogenase subunit E2 [Candidatus Kurthia equi]
MTERQEKRIPITGMRKQIYKNLVKSAFTIPHATGMDEVQVDALIAYKKVVDSEADVHITYLPIIIKLITQVLEKYPIFNATIDEDAREIVIRPDFNIGIAVATEEGLIVPVIKNVDKKTIAEIAVELNELTDKARQGKLVLSNIVGGTFTISNTGLRGGTYATPLINFPQVAILGIHAMKERPVILANREIGIGTMMGVSLSFDHRIIDGESVGYFMEELKNLIEHPEKIKN